MPSGIFYSWSESFALGTKVRIGERIRGGDGVEQPVGSHRCTGGLSALPLSEIAAGGEESEANQVGTTVSLPVELAPTLVDDLGEDEVVFRCDTCPGAD